jgi:hypothetical protein
MILNEKLKREKGNPVFLYKEGVFWVAYEQSAYYFWKQKGYKATKKLVKLIKDEVVSIGFPPNALSAFMETAHDLESYEMHDNSYVLHLKEPVDAAAFQEWRSQLPLQESPAVTKVPKPEIPAPSTSAELILAKLRDFPLADKTPVECMIFLSELKRWI